MLYHSGSGRVVEGGGTQSAAELEKIRPVEITEKLKHMISSPGWLEESSSCIKDSLDLFSCCIRTPAIVELPVFEPLQCQSCNDWSTCRVTDRWVFQIWGYCAKHADTVPEISICMNRLESMQMPRF